MRMGVDDITSAVRCTCYGDQMLPGAFSSNLYLCVFSVRFVSHLPEDGYI